MSNGRAHPERMAEPSVVQLEPVTGRQFFVEPGPRAAWAVLNTTFLLDLLSTVPDTRVMNRAYYSAPLEAFLQHTSDEILGALTRRSGFAVEGPQRHAWQEQIRILKHALQRYAGAGKIYFEYAVPRLGKRIDVVAIVQSTLFILEFKVGDQNFAEHARDQVWDYALDLKNFHETSHDKLLVPILIATDAEDPYNRIEKSALDDGVFRPLLSNEALLSETIRKVLEWMPAAHLRAEEWEAGRYRPTPTIVEAAMALYAGHQVTEISRSDATAKNLSDTTRAVEAVIRECRANAKKAICFVTGVPGAGKTLVGLNVATQHAKAGELHSVFLSGNGPLVAVLQEALVRDQVRRKQETGEAVHRGRIASTVKAFVQNVHHFRDEYLEDTSAPSDHIAVFDEAQRAWNLAQTADFMRRKKGKDRFDMSEPEFLISCMNRHKDWCVVVCLVGGGQEIYKGEAGISEWLRAIQRSFPDWEVHISPELRDAEYGAETTVQDLWSKGLVKPNPDLHLAASMRAFRADTVPALVKRILDLDAPGAKKILERSGARYPILLCRSVERAKTWLRYKARGSERYGIVVSSQAYRLRPFAIHVKAPADPVHWFLDDKDDVRSSYYLEDVATEFQVQGLELDWAAVVWDGDFRYCDGAWQHFSFRGTQWQRILAPERQTYQKNAYRVLLTRARQGMVIVVPEGDTCDPTRDPAFYDQTFSYLREIGLPVLV
jgi:hypothetical protein